MKIFLPLLLSLFLNSALFAGSQKEKNDIDYVALATMLFKDKHYVRANDALKNVNLQDNAVDKAQFYTLKGVVQSKLLQYKEANKSFYKAIENGQKAKTVYIYIAQNSFKIKDYKNAIGALARVEEFVKKNEKLMALKAECYYRLNDYKNAFAELKHLNQLYPEYYDAYRQRFVYFVKLGLYQSALEDADIYMKHAKPNEKITLSFINALRKANETTKAINLAEKAHLIYPKNAKITALLAMLYIDKDMIHAAADLFCDASLQDHKYIKDSSEMFRRAKEYVQALYKNSQITNPQEKYRQKIAIFLDFNDYERVTAAKRALLRNGLLKDQNIVYALAYAYYKIGEFDKAEYFLKKITRADLFKKAVMLRKNMDKCKNNHWECIL